MKIYHPAVAFSDYLFSAHSDFGVIIIFHLNSVNAFVFHVPFDYECGKKHGTNGS